MVLIGGRADAIGVHLPDARRVARPDTEDVHQREPHGALAAVRPLHLRLRRGREEAAQGSLLEQAGLEMLVYIILASTSDFSFNSRCILYMFRFQGKVPLLSLEALEQIHIFIFVLAVTHVALSAFTVLLGLVQVTKLATS